MAIANPVDTYEGSAVPLYPNKGTVITQQTAAGGSDVLTVSLGSTATDDALVLRAGTTERFVVEDGGNVAITQGAAGDVGLKLTQASTPTASAIQIAANDGTTIRWSVTKNHGVLWRVRTTRPTTGLTKGEMFIAFHGSVPKICICTSTAAQTVKQVRARTKTFGRLTA